MGCESTFIFRPSCSIFAYELWSKNTRKMNVIHMITKMMRYNKNFVDFVVLFGITVGLNIKFNSDSKRVINAVLGTS